MKPEEYSNFYSFHHYNNHLTYLEASIIWMNYALGKVNHNK